MLMTAVSSYALAPRTEKAIRAARSWSLRALQVADKATADAGWTGRPADPDAATCARAQSVALFNLGMLAEMNKDPEAEQFFAKSYETSTLAAFAEGRREAGDALRRIQGGDIPREVGYRANK